MSVPGLPRYERMRETALVDVLLFSPHSLQDLHSGKFLPLYNYLSPLWKGHSNETYLVGPLLVDLSCGTPLAHF